ncbi:hypothetical protein [Peptoniphilus indolicus]|uniref:2TM domain-containing protein n=1 Tax=Peptoniphilus indolicus TaxID=33030 RepID=A0A379D9U2_9FIRM|nr:hypothetical protein [Peptoniphilus indolicus]SUB74362.1 Uncharacterised protein [Peptoniphilus indolicus]
MERKQSSNHYVRHRRKKRKSNYSKFWVSTIIMLNVIFVVAIIYLFNNTGGEPSTLITAWFSFSTVELWQLARIKVKKLKNEEKIVRNNNTDNTNYGEWG